MQQKCEKNNHNINYMKEKKEKPKYNLQVYTLKLLTAS